MRQASVFTIGAAMVSVTLYLRKQNVPSTVEPNERTKIIEVLLVIVS